MGDLVHELQELIVRSLRLLREPASLDPDAGLFGDHLGLDSVDAVQVLCAVEQHFGVTIADAALGRNGINSLRDLARILADLGVAR